MGVAQKKRLKDLQEDEKEIQRQQLDAVMQKHFADDEDAAFQEWELKRQLEQAKKKKLTATMERIMLLLDKAKKKSSTGMNSMLDNYMENAKKRPRKRKSMMKKEKEL